MDIFMETTTEQCGMSFSRPKNDTLLIQLSGEWKIGAMIPSLSELEQAFDSAPRIRELVFHTEKVTGWDSALLTFLLKIVEQAEKKNIHINKEGVPPGVQRLLILATAVPERKGARREAKSTPFLEQAGQAGIDFWQATIDMLGFIGEAFSAFIRLLSGKAQFRRSELFVTLQETGAQALPIVSLISVLVGLILAFVGAIQLRMFGAQIYVADLVGIAMVRVMGAIMTGIIMAGRTGAAFAAQLGTMQVNEEIDALKTMGISPMEFLVLPRMLALMLMMPLLCVYADLMGILGGLIVGVSMLDLNVMEYYVETTRAVSLNDFWIGIFHSVVFGVLVALAGCLRGMQSGRSASSVGAATTSAVVTGIVSIIVATAIITIICEVLGI
jgi:phospholipid/cholesterol/gamma-HCH transport system permease protein